MILKARGKLRLWIRRLLKVVFSRLPFSTLERLNWLANQSLGRGFVPENLDAEVGAASSLLGGHDLDGEWFCDIGANVGLYSSALLHRWPKANAIAFEPSDHCQGPLVELQRKFRNLVVEQIALGSQSGSSVLYFDRPGSGHASLHKRDLGFMGLSFEGTEEVAVRRLDDALRDRGIRPIFLKLDVEGHELEVLRGAEESIQTVQLVQFEFGGTSIDAGTRWRDYWTFFNVRGFSIFRLTPTRLLKVVRYSEEDELPLFATYFAVRRRE